MPGPFGRGAGTPGSFTAGGVASDIVGEALRLLESRDRDYVWPRRRMADAAEQVRCDKPVQRSNTPSDASPCGQHFLL